MSQNNDLYYSKYLKYKNKYLDLKKSLVGSGLGACYVCRKGKCSWYSSDGKRNGNCRRCTHPYRDHA